MEFDERYARNGIKLMRGLRYDLAVRAKAVSSDECMFPACGCLQANCVSRPLHRRLAFGAAILEVDVGAR